MELCAGMGCHQAERLGPWWLNGEWGEGERLKEGRIEGMRNWNLVSIESIIFVLW